MSGRSYDAIVIGVGSMGAPACYYLAKRGYTVLGIEQFDITHELGSHTGQSRIIRKAYFEHPDYVPLLSKAYKNWKDLEKETGEKVYFPTGLAYFGKEDNEMMKGVRSSASLFDIQVEKTVKEKFPQFHLPDNFEALYEPDAGFLTPEKAIQFYTKQAIQKGAAIHSNEKVVEWKKEGNNIAVITDKNIYYCKKLILSAGAWVAKLIPGLQQTITVTRQVIAWVKPKSQEEFELNNFPCWLLADDEIPGCFYGFPVLPREKFGKPYGLKIAYHHPGITAKPVAGISISDPQFFLSTGDHYIK